MRSVKITVVGDPAVGKTALCVRYRDEKFVQTHQITYFDMYSFKVRVGSENEECSIALWDTAGQDELSGLRPHLYQDTDVFLVCFSFDNLSSIESINDKWYFELQKLCPNAKKILVGTKLDTKSVSELAPNNKYSSSVTNEQVESLKRKLKFDHYFECSAKTGAGVHEVIEEAINLGLNLNENCCNII